MALDDFQPYISVNENVYPLKCFYPKLINGFYVPCGKCEFCLRSRAREWAFRLEAESFDKYCYNVLLTYDDASLKYYKGEPTVDKVDIQLFLKRFRTSIAKSEHFSTKIKYFLCAEYGGKNHRPHYHMIVFSEKPLHTRSADPYAKIQKILSFTWRHGLCDIEPLNNVGGSVNYLTAYMTQYSDGRKYDKHNKPFLMMSRTGLGKSWIYRHPNLVRKMVEDMNYTLPKQGSIPRYLRRKIMPEEQQIARADCFYEYSKLFSNNLNSLKHGKRSEYIRKLREDREQQQQRERDNYRKGKVHANNSNTSQLSRRASTAKE